MIYGSRLHSTGWQFSLLNDTFLWSCMAVCLKCTIHVPTVCFLSTGIVLPLLPCSHWVPLENVAWWSGQDKNKSLRLASIAVPISYCIQFTRKKKYGVHCMLSPLSSFISYGRRWINSCFHLTRHKFVMSSTPYRWNRSPKARVRVCFSIKTGQSNVYFNCIYTVLGM